jgi:hypothetical protein
MAASCWRDSRPAERNQERARVSIASSTSNREPGIARLAKGASATGQHGADQHVEHEVDVRIFRDLSASDRADEHLAAEHA